MHLARRVQVVVLAQHEQARLRLHIEQAVDQGAVALPRLHSSEASGGDPRARTFEQLASVFLRESAALLVQFAQLGQQRLAGAQADASAEIHDRRVLGVPV